MRPLATALFGTFLLLGSLACDEVVPDRPAELELDDGRTVELPAGAQIHAVRVGQGPSGAEQFIPDTVRARPGDVVRFIAGDRASHAVVFQENLLSPDALSYLEDTGRLRGPPLISRETSWVVGLEDAPAGLYPFLCTVHAVDGVMIVEAAE